MTMIFHATAPFSLFCDDGVVARPFWRFDDATQMVADFPEHSFRIFERQSDGTMRSIFYMPADLKPDGAVRRAARVGRAER